jgi:hypothetical protein
VRHSPTEHLCRCRSFFSFSSFWLKLCCRYQCNGSDRQRWMIQRGSTKVRLAKTNFCLDAGASQWFGSQPVLLYVTRFCRSCKWRTTQVMGMLWQSSCATVVLYGWQPHCARRSRYDPSKHDCYCSPPPRLRLLHGSG